MKEKEVQPPTKEQIKQWAKEIYDSNVPPDEISDELWDKIQYIAAYMFNKNQLPS